MKYVFLLLQYGFLFLFSTNAYTQDTSKQEGPACFTTKHEILLNGKKIMYRADAAETYLANDSGQVVGAIFSVHYALDDVKPGNGSSRPVTFVFNGGPGSASVWLHLGLLGPRLMDVDSEAKKDDGAAPYNWRTNPYFLIEHTDLVFVDPIGTGFSTAKGKAKNEQFWGLKEDAASLANFIRTWVGQNKRWQSKKYIIGESFGTTRAAAIVNELERGGQQMSLNGLVLISQALDYAGSTSMHDNITSYITYLPSMAATAWYHKKAGTNKSLTDFVTEARAFAYDTYLPALFKGNRLEESKKMEIARSLTYFTGLKSAYVLHSDLKILINRFRSELLRDSNLVLGQLDGRYTSAEIDRTADSPTLGDPASYKIEAAYTALLNDYFGNELGVTMKRPYLTGNDNIYPRWNWKTTPEGQGWEPSFVNTAPQLATTLRRNPDMRILVASGYYDLITPFFDAEYTFSRHGFTKDQIEFKYYQAGHMMYNRREDFESLSKDLLKFYTQK